VVVVVLLLAPGSAFAQAALAVLPACATPEATLTGQGAIDAAAAPACVGWLAAPPANGKGLVVPAPPLTADARVNFALPGAGVVANELFSVIAAIAVERARRQGLAIVHDAIADGVCDLAFPIPASGNATFHLGDTCTLVRTTDLLALVGQGRALRTALTSDALSAADLTVGDRLKAFPPLARSASAAVLLAKRVAADPQAHLTKNDVWLITDAFLNGTWPTLSGPEQQTLTTLQIALASARVYLEAVKNAPPDETVDLAYAIRKVTATACGAQPNCPYLEPAASKLVIEWTNVAIKAASAMSGDGKTEDFRTRLRSSVQLVFQAYRALTETQPAPVTGIGTRVMTFPVWVQTITLATIDGDAPQLIAAIAQLASDAATTSCSDQCPDRRKIAALLTGIATYALTYEEIPPDADADARVALLQAQRDARQAALDSVIDAATDRRGRDGQLVWSMGTGVGATLIGKQRLDLTPSGDTTSLESFKGQLHVPLGVALQRLPGQWWPLPFHTMFTALDLGNYVARTQEAGSSPDWQAIFAPGFQFGIPIGTPGNFVVIGASLEYAPRFTSETETGAASGSRSAIRRGLFVHYFVPLWDLN
jgi:hypothetical protein